MNADLLSRFLELLHVRQRGVLAEADGYIDPERIQIARTETLANGMGILVLFTFRDVLGLNLKDSSLVEALGDFEAQTGYSLGLLARLAEMPQAEHERLERWFQSLWSLDFSSLSLSETYETLLDFHAEYRDGDIRYVRDRAGRNRAGAYYTPQALADEAVRKVMDRYIEQRIGYPSLSHDPRLASKIRGLLIELVSSSQIVDFSSGTGRFLLAVVRYIERYVLTSPVTSDERNQVYSQLATKIWGVDVDPLALELGRLELALAMGDASLAATLAPHFLHGNPLLPPTKGVSAETRWRLAAGGRIYHPELGLSAEGPQLGSFDVIVGNPPWEKLRIEERAFFRTYAPEVAACVKKDDRLAAIARLAEIQPKLHTYYQDLRDQLDTCKTRIQASPLFEASSAGELNTNVLFTELAARTLASGGCAGLVVKSALLMAPVNARLFAFLVEGRRIAQCFDFVNRKKIFDIDSRERFTILILGESPDGGFDFRAGLEAPEELRESADLLRIDAATLATVNPLTRMLPSVSTTEELDFLFTAARRHPHFAEAYPNCRYGRLVHYTNHAEYIIRTPEPGYLPIYEGKFIELYDGRFATYEGLPDTLRYSSKASALPLSEDSKCDPFHFPESRFFIAEDKWRQLTRRYLGHYSLMWRSLTSASNRRTCIASILPHVPASQSVQFLQADDDRQLGVILAFFNSVPFDFMVRLKLNGIDLTQTIIKQVAIPARADLQRRVVFQGEQFSIEDHLLARVAALLGNDARLWEFCRGIKPAGYPSLFSIPRKRLFAELDYLVAEAYGLSELALAKLANRFPDFYTSDEWQAYFGAGLKGLEAQNYGH